jgi:hypothetical protein
VQNRLKHHLQIRHLPLEIADNAQLFIASIKKTHLYSASFIHSVNEAYVQSLKNLFEVLLAVAVMGLIASLLLKPVSMNKELETQHVLQRNIGSDHEVVI